jgi:hypothetical protein
VVEVLLAPPRPVDAGFESFELQPCTAQAAANVNDAARAERAM